MVIVGYFDKGQLRSQVLKAKFEAFAAANTNRRFTFATHEA